jgi:hypothetical protein
LLQNLNFKRTLTIIPGKNNRHSKCPAKFLQCPLYRKSQREISSSLPSTLFYVHTKFCRPHKNKNAFFICVVLSVPEASSFACLPFYPMATTSSAMLHNFPFPLPCHHHPKLSSFTCRTSLAYTHKACALAFNGGRFLCRPPRSQKSAAPIRAFGLNSRFLQMDSPETSSSREISMKSIGGESGGASTVSQTVRSHLIGLNVCEPCLNDMC